MRACMFPLTHFVFWILQVEHEGSVFVLVLAVGAKAEVEHFLFNCNCQPSHLTLSHIQVITVAHPGVNKHNKHWRLFKGIKLNIYRRYFSNNLGTLNKAFWDLPLVEDVCQRAADVLSHLVVGWRWHGRRRGHGSGWMRRSRGGMTGGS